MRLHLYGALPAGHVKWFESHAGALVRRGAVVHQPLPVAEQVMATVARHHIGLTLDPNDCLNRSLTVCNKLFLYLQAGLACIASDTPGHWSVLGAEGPCGAFYQPGNVGALASALERLREPGERLRAQLSAWELGQRKYAWGC